MLYKLIIRISDVTLLAIYENILRFRFGDHRCVSKWYTTYVGDRFSEVMTQ